MSCGRGFTGAASAHWGCYCRLVVLGVLQGWAAEWTWAGLGPVLGTDPLLLAAYATVVNEADALRHHHRGTILYAVMPGHMST